MSFNGLAHYVSFLESRGDLARVKCRVDPVLEITEIADRMVKNGGKALLFEETGTGFPLLINAFASDDRMAAAIGRSSLDDAGEEIFSLVESFSQARGLSAKLARLPQMFKPAEADTAIRRGAGVNARRWLSPLQTWISCPYLSAGLMTAGRFITLPWCIQNTPLRADQTWGCTACR